MLIPYSTKTEICNKNSVFLCLLSFFIKQCLALKMPPW